MIKIVDAVNFQEITNLFWRILAKIRVYFQHIANSLSCIILIQNTNLFRITLSQINNFFQKRYVNMFVHKYTQRAHFLEKGCQPCCRRPKAYMDTLKKLVVADFFCKKLK